MAEGAPLLREYGVKLIEGSNPSLSAIKYVFSETILFELKKTGIVVTHP